jgi:hypothetical protein
MPIYSASRKAGVPLIPDGKIGVAGDFLDEGIIGRAVFRFYCEEVNFA